MTYPSDDSSASPNPHHAMIGATSPSDALVAQTNGAPPVPVYPAGPMQPAQDVLHGSMDASGFLNSLRRRWMMALGLGSVIAVFVALILFWLFPESSSAVALFQVKSEAPALVYTNVGNDTQKFEILQKTQLALLKSDFVLQAAVRDPSISSLSALAEEGDPVQWLQDNLIVDFPQQSEILSISISGDYLPEELQLLVDAVAKAYMNEVVYAEKQRRLMTRDALAKSLGNINGEVERKLEEFHDIAKEVGAASQSFERDTEGELLLREIGKLMEKKAKTEDDMSMLRTNFAILQQRFNDPHMLELEVDEILAVDPQIGMLNEQLMTKQFELVQLQGVLGGRQNRQTAKIQKEIDGLNQQINQYREQQKQAILAERRREPNYEFQQALKEFQIQAGYLGQSLTASEELIEEKLADLRVRNEKSVELMIRDSHLERLRDIADDMSIKLESIDVEGDAPDRIQLIQPATVDENINKMERYAIAGLGGISMFALVAVGIAFLEFRNRHLNGPDEVDEGLGIRVVGTLPSLIGRRMLDPNHPVVAQLTESIDSVRTLLMHDSTSKRRQVVLITSAVTMEGRTTVASQLAASLARAGRRTLLVDGDLRSPALHALFDVPLEDGLCEVLRAESDAADVIRPTHAEGLWLMTAGYCDVDAIHALATEQLQPVFDKLRADYDFVIIDGAPVLCMSDALIFGKYCDGAILSVRRDYSQMPKINQAADLLRNVNVQLFGSVVNGVPTKSDTRVTQLRLITPKAERELLEEAETVEAGAE